MASTALNHLYAAIMSAENSQPTTKYAKTMTGHIYAYPVHTVGEFKQKISNHHDIPPQFLKLIGPDDEKETCDEDPLEESIVYFLLMDTPHPVLLDYINPNHLNHTLLIENPSYPINEARAQSLAPSELDYLAMYPERIEIVLQQRHRLTGKGWRRLFLSLAAPLRLVEDDLWKETQQHFYEHAPLLATNTEAIPLIERLLEEHVPMLRPDIFWRNLSRNENAIPLLLQHPDKIRYDTLSENYSAIPFILSCLENEPESASRFNWRLISTHPEAEPIFKKFPEQIDHDALQYNTTPFVIEWIRRYTPVEDIKWEFFCSHTEPSYIAFIEEHLDHITSEGWKALCYNPSAVDLLKRHPEKIHWTLLCCNPSEEVIPMIEDYLAQSLASSPILPSMSPLLSDIGPSMIAISFVRHRVREPYHGKDLWHEEYRSIINRGAISLHPHALPLLKANPWLIDWNSFSIRPDIYREVTGSLL